MTREHLPVKHLFQSQALSGGPMGTGLCTALEPEELIGTMDMSSSTEVRRQPGSTAYLSALTSPAEANDPETQRVWN